MGKKGGKKKEPGQGSGGGPPEQAPAGQSSSGPPPARAESQPSMSSQAPSGQPAQRGGGQGRGGVGRGAPRQEGQQQLPSAFSGQGQTPRQDAPQQQQQQQQHQQGGQQQGGQRPGGQQGGYQQGQQRQGGYQQGQQHQGGYQQGQQRQGGDQQGQGQRGRGGGRGQGRGAGFGRGGGPPQGQQQQQQFPAMGRGQQQPQQQFPAMGRGQQQPQQQQQQQQGMPPWMSQSKAPAAQQPQQQKPAWGIKSASEPAPPAAAAAPQQVPQQQDAPPKQETSVAQVTEQMAATSLGGQKAGDNRMSPMKEAPKPRPIEQLGIPKRKNPMKAGTLGKPLKVYTNMMEIKFGPKFKTNVIHYDVTIDPDKPKYLMRPVFNKAQKEFFPSRFPAFDGKKNAFSAGRLPIDEGRPYEVTVYNEDGKERQYKITFKFAAELDLAWLKKVGPGLSETERNQISLQALDIILRSAPAMRATTVGRSFFTPPSGRVMSLGGGMDVWVGLFQSAVLGWKPLLNVDVAHKGFPSPQSVLDLMKTICGCDGQGGGGGRPQYGRQQQYGRYQDQPQGPTELTVDLIQRYREDITKFLKGLKVVYEIPGQATSRRTQRVNGLVHDPRNNRFEHNGQKITIEQYYKLEKKYQIRYPQFPCLWVGNREKNIHVPVELCTIVGGQATQKKLDDKQTASMIKFAATGTDERRNKIMDAFNQMGHNNDACMKEFGISVSGEFEKVSARVLEPPALAYHQQNQVRVMKGVWRPDRFFEPSGDIQQDNSWTILSLNRHTQDKDLFYLYEQLEQTGRQLGMTIGKPATPFQHIQPRGQDTRELDGFFRAQKQKNIRLVVCIIPDMKGPYSKVKQVSELSVGVLTQCLKGNTLRKLNAATTSNILLKINAKLNGINHKISPNTRNLPACLNAPCMIVGADVTHPSPDAKDIPSIAAVAASHDPCAFKYNIEIRLQPPRMEIIQDLAEIMKIQLIFFFKKTGHKPLRIIFYRDGVSEGQFSQVMDAELVAIRKACSSLPGDYKPPISFMVVQKRHHTRFFPVDSRDTDDRNCNVRAGTIVDTEITHPSDIDFYLVSHASIQGTARPTKYRCLWDENGMNEDQIEQLTYFLCHMFSRCTRSVSYPTPTYYAHLAAFRARALTQDVNINLDNLPQEQLRKLTLNQDVSKLSPMFFV